MKARKTARVSEQSIRAPNRARPISSRRRHLPFGLEEEALPRAPQAAGDAGFVAAGGGAGGAA
jgi:hypothetical protein